MAKETAKERRDRENRAFFADDTPKRNLPGQQYFQPTPQALEMFKYLMQMQGQMQQTPDQPQTGDLETALSGVDKPATGPYSADRRSELDEKQLGIFTSVHEKDELSIRASDFGGYEWLADDWEFFKKTFKIVPDKKTKAAQDGIRKHEISEISSNHLVYGMGMHIGIPFGTSVDDLARNHTPTWIEEFETPTTYVFERETKVPEHMSGLIDKTGYEFKDRKVEKFWMRSKADRIKLLSPDDREALFLEKHFGVPIDEDSNVMIVYDKKPFRECYEEGKPYWPHLMQVFFTAEMILQLQDPEYSERLDSIGKLSPKPSVYSDRWWGDRNYERDLKNIPKLQQMDPVQIVAVICDRDKAHIMYAQKYDDLARETFWSTLANTTYRVKVEDVRSHRFLGGKALFDF